jgi:hypothetical protein
MDNLYKDKS